MILILITTCRHEHLESVEDLVRVKQFPIETLTVEAAITQVPPVLSSAA